MHHQHPPQRHHQVNPTASFLADSSSSTLDLVVRAMAYPSNTTNFQNTDSGGDIGSLRPRSRTSLYPAIRDFNWPSSSLNASDILPKGDTLKQAPSAKTGSEGDLEKKKNDPETILTNSNHHSLTRKSHSLSPAVKRSSLSSIQTLPSDCSAEDLAAIQAALIADADDDDEDEEEKSRALVQQLIREELGLPPARITTAISSSRETTERSKDDVEEEQKPITTKAQQKKEATQDLIYQLCLKLDEVSVDVKSENWQVLAPHEINKLELFCFDCNSKRVSVHEEDNKCLICQHDYEHQDSLRKLRCGHYFHQECVDPWLMKHDLCPVCRKPIDQD